MWYFEKDEDGYWVVSNGLQTFQVLTKNQAMNLSGLLNYNTLEEDKKCH